jgi:4'-phosphopantetheinyl transferase
MKYLFVRDAKMSLASQLLKHLVIHELGGVSWNESTATRDANGKPCYVPNNGRGNPLEFNVSHQAGLVPLVASASPAVEVGIDVVCVNERLDNDTLCKGGFFAWVDMHASVFSQSEVDYMKYDVETLSLPIVIDVEGNGKNAIANCQKRDEAVSWTSNSGVFQKLDANVIIDAKLRRFFAFWGLREAYIKMTGEALVAPWLQELEFRRFKVPMANKSAPLDDSDLLLGEITTEFDIYFKGERVENVTMELRALGCNYMVATAARNKDGRIVHRNFPGFLNLTLNDIIARSGL